MLVYTQILWSHTNVEDVLLYIINNIYSDEQEILLLI